MYIPKQLVMKGSSVNIRKSMPIVEGGAIKSVATKEKGLTKVAERLAEVIKDRNRKPKPKNITF